MAFSQEDVEAVRSVARQVAEIAALPVQEEKRKLWRKVNALEECRPLVWINELPWWELDCEELHPRAGQDFARGVEARLRNTLYLWRHMPVDMVVDGFYAVGYASGDTGYGVEGQSTLGESADGYGFGSREYIPVLNTDEDIEKIQMPVVTVDWEATDRNYAMACELLGDVMPVKKQGMSTQWYAPWDILIQWYGVTELMVDMVDRPEFVDAVTARMVDALCSRLDQQEELGLLSATNNNHRVGSGGLGITDLLPQPDCPDRDHCRAIDQWGTSTGQIFSEVSPEMHWEFCLKHEMRYLERYGLNCYGCCEPLHNKMGILRRVPRLRRISMSTWIDVEKAAEELKADYIFSYKPNPAVLAWDKWDPQEGRRDLCSVLERTNGCRRELIMKDVSTVRNEPHRVWEWCALAMEVAKAYE